MCLQCEMPKRSTFRPAPSAIDILDVVQVRAGLHRDDTSAHYRGVVTFRHRSTVRVLFPDGKSGMFLESMLIRIGPAIGGAIPAAMSA